MALQLKNWYLWINMTNEELKIKLNTTEHSFAGVGEDYPPNS